MQREVALKEYMPNALARRRADGQVELRAPQYESTFAAGRKSFVNEAKLLAQFDHKALVKVLRVLRGQRHRVHGDAALSRPHAEAAPARVAEGRRGVDQVDARAAARRARDAARRTLLHRDVAPDNILILDSGGPLLLDFGAARRIIGDMTQAVTVVIKPGYAPVEQYADDNSLQQGPWTDIYALAAVVRLAITGKPPATSVTRMVSDPVKPLAEVAQGYGASFLRAIDYGLAVRPEDRPQRSRSSARRWASRSCRHDCRRLRQRQWRPRARSQRRAWPPFSAPARVVPAARGGSPGPIGEKVRMHSHGPLPLTPASAPAAKPTLCCRGPLPPQAPRRVGSRSRS